MIHSREVIAPTRVTQRSQSKPSLRCNTPGGLSFKMEWDLNGSIYSPILVPRARTLATPVRQSADAGWWSTCQRMFWLLIWPLLSQILHSLTSSACSMKQLTKPKNIIHRLMLNQLGLSRNTYRNALQILRMIISDPESKFVECTRIKSPSAISYDESMFYLNNFKRVKVLWGLKGEPSDLYKLPGTYRFRDTISIRTPVSKTPLPRKDFRPSFFALDKHNHLYRFDLLTGEKLDDIYLGTTYLFTAMNWESHGERIVLQTAYLQKNGRRDQSILQAVCLFSVFPLKFIALLELTSDLVGREVKSANVSEGLLILGTSSKVRLCAMDELIKDEHRICSCNLYESNFGCTHGPVGVFPHGLPLNFRSSPLPDVLFEMQCAGQSVEFGGFPFQCIYQPHRKRNQYQVYAVESCQKIAQLEAESIIADSGQVFFHWDDSGRIINIKEKTVTVYKTVEDEEQLKLKQLFTLKFDPITRTTKRTSSRQRAVTKRCRFPSDESEIFKLDHENELEYLIIFGIEESNNCMGVIHIYDNESGQLVKKINMDITLREWYEYSLIMDIDRIIVIETREKKCTAFVYKLDRSTTG